MARLAAPLVLLALVLAAGCGKDEPTPPEPGPETPPPAVSPRPDDPQAALAWIREAHREGDKDELRRRLAAWPMDDPAWVDTEETQLVLTWRIRTALQDGAIEDAATARALLLQYFDGHGVSPEGRGLTPEMIRLGLIEEARLLTRRRAEGPNPKAADAEAAWKLGADLLTKHDVEDGDRLERSRRWALWDTFDRWVHAMGAKPGPALGTRPMVVVLADDFALGEIIFQSVLGRWVRDGADAGLVGVLIPIKRGQVRFGMRRVTAESEAQEVAAIEEDAAKARLVTTWDEDAGLFAAPFDEGAKLAKAMGLEKQEVGLLLIDAKGRIVARMSGTGIDPRALDPVVQKLTR